MNALRQFHTTGDPDRVMRPGDPDSPLGARRSVRRACTGPVALLLLALMIVPPAQGQDERTFAALQMAYQRERDSGLQYERFAARAEADGIAAAATAFRVAAVGESVHAALHAGMIAQLGGTPKWTPTEVEVEATLDNLERAIENEAHEASCLYRQLVDAIRPECKYDAIAVLNYARGAEATHVETFTRVLMALQRVGTPEPLLAALAPPVIAWRETPQVLVVCLGDGSVFPAEFEGRCPNCGSGAEMRRSVAMPAPEEGPWLALDPGTR